MIAGYSPPDGPRSRSETGSRPRLGPARRHRDWLLTFESCRRVRAKLRRPALLAKASDALDAVAVQEGLSHEQLVDRTVPAFGLGPDGVREEQAGDCVVRLDVDGPVLRFVNASGRVVKSAPQSIRKDPVLADLKATLKDLKRTQAAERLRLEQMLIVERELSWQEAEQYFFDHPVTGPYTRALIWRLPDGFAGLPVRSGGGWALAGASGESVRPGADTPVRLWHPIQESPEGVRGWRILPPTGGGGSVATTRLSCLSSRGGPPLRPYRAIVVFSRISASAL
ncbi:DUF4132 domain-containing protein [Nonomuraea sp. K274]|uniref:DUF4132 domain-containing protein n=1 Tax=Nonomuraea cypriaca TaxID=1187855 RepID=A0A931A3Y6_9ACTN|nr:DUF4132 domain-containing protein [Nonomuraea cypriaca]MBF8184575.1 DUF4132 domain-containing protein [Nonomuraea cypriaca]